MKTKTTTSTMIAIAALAGLSCAQAALINLNIKAGADDIGLLGVVGGSGLTWNQHATTAPTSPLVDSTGMPTTVSVGTSAGVLGLGSWGAPALTVLKSGYFQFDKGADFTVTISGLVIGGIYDLFILTRSNGTGVESNVGTFRTLNANASGNQVINSFDVHNGSTFVEGQNYAKFNSIVANVDGEISFTSDGSEIGEIISSGPGSTDPYRLMVSGLQINQVPEPSTALLGGLGLLALLRRRR